MSDYLSRFDTAFLPLLGVRGPTMRAVIRECVARRHKSIVETGCVRQKDNWAGDGQSTVIWEDYIKWTAGSFQSIDIDSAACDVAREVAPNAAVACNNSVKQLLQDTGTIDLLYLDSYDVDMNNQHPAALHCLMELLSARKRLMPGSIVFVDDSPVDQDFVVQGKGRYVAEYFRELGVAPFTFAYQVAWIIPDA